MHHIISPTGHDLLICIKTKPSGQWESEINRLFNYGRTKLVSLGVEILLSVLMSFYLRIAETQDLTQ